MLLPFRWPFRVRYSEVDYQGIAYNAHYLTWFDVTIHEFFKAVPYEYTKERVRTGCDFHTVRALVEFKQPLRLDDDFEVVLDVSRLGRSSLTFALTAIVKGDDATSATGELVWVHADRASERSAPLPDELRQRLTAGTTG
jgi:acyl-CoA thioester hydrolase